MATFPANIAPADALAFMRDKVPLPTETWTDIWAGAHARAFVVAGANREAIVTDFHVAIQKAIAEGQTLEQFRKEGFDAIVEKHGWTHRGKRGWRSRVIFETNTRTAYMAAKWRAFVDNRLMRPFLRYVGILDDRIRPQHRAWHDTVLPVGHPWWDTHFPPNGWGCRCDVQSLSQRDLDRRGLRVQPEAPPGATVTREVRSGGTTKWVQVPRGIDPGWDYNVGKAGFGGYIPPRLVKMIPLVSPIMSKVTPEELPAVPTMTVPLPKPPADEEALRQMLRDVLGGETASFADPLGAILQVGQRVADHLLEKLEENRARAIYFPFIREVIERPQEIWVGFATNSVTGRVEMRRRYVRYVVLRKGKLLGLVSDVRGRELVALTFFVGSKPRDDRMRGGLLLYQKLEQQE